MHYKKNIKKINSQKFNSMKTNPKSNNFLKPLLLLSILMFLFSCGTKQDIVYFQGVDDVGSSISINNYNPTFRTDDMLTINVSALDQDAARPFNLPVVSFMDDDGAIGRASIQSYLIDVNGNIEFPVLGTIKLAGLNKIQAITLIKDLLKEYIKDPIVNIRTINFKVTVLGEVNRPGTFTIPNERLTIIEALGLAGDLTIQAERKNILVIREGISKKTYTRVDLNSEEIFNSPVYYLTQNDVIYVEPNNSRVKSSTVGPSTSTTLGVISTLVTVAALIISITR